MPKYNQWIIRLALLYLVAGFTSGGLVLLQKAFPFLSWAWMLRPIHIELLFFGWMVQLIFGVGSWILPRTPSRRNQRPLLGAVLLLNAGVLCSCLSVIVPLSYLPLSGKLLELASVATFASYILPRVRPFITHSHD